MTLHCLSVKLPASAIHTGKRALNRIAILAQTAAAPGKKSDSHEQR